MLTLHNSMEKPSEKRATYYVLPSLRTPYSVVVPLEIEKKSTHSRLGPRLGRQGTRQGKRAKKD